MQQPCQPWNDALSRTWLRTFVRKQFGYSPRPSAFLEQVARRLLTRDRSRLVDEVTDLERQLTERMASLEDGLSRLEKERDTYHANARWLTKSRARSGLCRPRSDDRSRSNAAARTPRGDAIFTRQERNPPNARIGQP
jgi:hypothetical protein